MYVRRRREQERWRREIWAELRGWNLYVREGAASKRTRVLWRDYSRSRGVRWRSAGVAANPRATPRASSRIFQSNKATWYTIEPLHESFGVWRRLGLKGS